MNKARDMLGQPIEVGDIIAYGARSGNTGCVHVYQVDKIVQEDANQYGIPKFALKVVVLEYDRESCAPLHQRMAVRRRTTVRQLDRAVLTRMTEADLVRVHLASADARAAKKASRQAFFDKRRAAQ